jgi:hypothetical protein
MSRRLGRTALSLSVGGGVHEHENEQKNENQDWGALGSASEREIHGLLHTVGKLSEID